MIEGIIVGVSTTILVGIIYSIVRLVESKIRNVRVFGKNAFSRPWLAFSATGNSSDFWSLHRVYIKYTIAGIVISSPLQEKGFSYKGNGIVKNGDTVVGHWKSNKDNAHNSGAFIFRI
ncbi:MAG: hypothetical protein AAF723_01055, partial [Pseudomonadota bacterium]